MRTTTARRREKLYVINTFEKIHAAAYCMLVISSKAST